MRNRGNFHFHFLVFCYSNIQLPSLFHRLPCLCCRFKQTFTTSSIPGRKKYKTFNSYWLLFFPLLMYIINFFFCFLTKWTFHYLTIYLFFKNLNSLKNALKVFLLCKRFLITFTFSILKCKLVVSPLPMSQALCHSVQQLEVLN